MRAAPWAAGIVLGLASSCGVPPGEIGGSSHGDGDSSSTASAGTTATSQGNGTGPVADGSGDATQGSQGTSSADGGTTQGVDPTAGSSSSSDASSGTDEGTTVGVGDSGGTTDTGESTGPAPSCDELYGTAPGYELCMETEDECHFNADTAGGNCFDMCASLGGTCLDAFDNSTACVILSFGDDCFTNRTNEICVCNR
ncbi:hypothetical protein [Paraliomyxa miuraensis]|uniref:hypothetical protein n=1 Tax=Paraliomyxa miuraensis TaxID=376150 RepID=UPI0022560061|nr:hypothetical protein [Paraliomyxa miuraensis]MCX4241058.1 hypothetical protein [Paraliomyxa miuraensis]